MYLRDPQDGSLTLVGALFIMPPGQEGPMFGGPVAAWHSHGWCIDFAAESATRPSDDGVCDRGQKIGGRVEMMHVWFTDDLQSAYARRAPADELLRFARALEA